MELQELFVHEEDVIASNPFGVPMDAPLQKQAAMQIRAPKFDDIGDIGRYGSRGIG
jgi:hypothetical protein